MSFEDRQMMRDLEKNGADMDVDNEYDSLPLPPGEEAMFLSHEGGEYELCQQLFQEPAGSGTKYVASTSTPLIY